MADFKSIPEFLSSFGSEEDGKIQIEGTVEYITYQSESTGYTVAVVSVDDDEMTVVGNLVGIEVGDWVRLVGEWTVHQTYGEQFRVDAYDKELPATTDAIIKYLSSGIIKGVGRKTAERIAGQFGADTFSVIENHPDILADIPGISLNKAREISDQLKSQSGLRNFMMFFREYFGPATSVRIYKKLGANAVEMIKGNPYLLYGKVNGVTFRSCEDIADSVGFDKSSESRIIAGIKYCLAENANKHGHTFIPYDRLVPLVSQFLEVGSESVENTLNSVNSEIIVTELAGMKCVYLRYYYDAELYIVRKLGLLNKVFPHDNAVEVERVIAQIEFEENIEYAAMQKKAIHTAIENGVMILTGGPGTGKTTIIRAIIRLAERMGYNVALAAPTGRAAKRMSEATSYEAKTIHRMLEMKYIDDEPKFSKDENNLLDEDFFIIDETSMVDTVVMAALLKAIKPGARIVFIGDADQLPSVGAGNVFCDLISSDTFAVVRLTEIYRQAIESRIVTNAHAINNGELPVLDDKSSDFFFMPRDEADICITVADLCKVRLPKKYGSDVIDDIQVITPSHKGPAGTEALNPLLQSVLNPPSKDKKEKKFRDTVFRVGDKIMQNKNNYDIEWDRLGERGAGIFNGDIGIIKDIDLRDSVMTIDFDGRIANYDFDILEDIEHAYAVTIHKSQGSEYPIVIIPIYSFTSKLLTRNLLYTAVTRAQKMVIIVGRQDVIRGMVENHVSTSRYTGLNHIIEKYENN